MKNLVKFLKSSLYLPFEVNCWVVSSKRPEMHWYLETCASLAKCFHFSNYEGNFDLLFPAHSSSSHVHFRFLWWRWEFVRNFMGIIKIHSPSQTDSTFRNNNNSAFIACVCVKTNTNTVFDLQLITLCVIF